MPRGRLRQVEQDVCGQVSWHAHLAAPLAKRCLARMAKKRVAGDGLSQVQRRASQNSFGQLLSERL
jgi:hypothetical protein